MPPMKPPTRAEQIRTTLSDDIVHGRLRPGDALDEAGLAQRFAVSRTPIREAIRQLEASGFAEARPRRGAVVAAFTPQRIDEMFAVMAEVEALAARWAARAMTAPERHALEAMHRASNRHVVDGDLPAYQDHNFRFHEAIYRGAHNGYLAELALHVRQRVAPFRRAQFEAPSRLTRSYAEHDRIVEAILRADGDRAAREMQSHMSIVRGAVDLIPAMPEAVPA
jgi:DNA-binding GntR family transcriptional regulator